jgi:hypothetical protein
LGASLPISGDVALDSCVDGIVGKLDAERAGLASVNVGGGGEGEGGEEGGEEDGEVHVDGGEWWVVEDVVGKRLLWMGRGSCGWL